MNSTPQVTQDSCEQLNDQTSSTQISRARQLGLLLLIGLTLFVMGSVLFGTAHAGTSDSAFKGLYDFVSTMVAGYTGKAVALIALIGGAIGTSVSGKPMLLIMGLVIAAALFFGPTVIGALLTATV